MLVIRSGSEVQPKSGSLHVRDIKSLSEVEESPSEAHDMFEIC